MAPLSQGTFDGATCDSFLKYGLSINIAIAMLPIPTKITGMPLGLRCCLVRKPQRNE